MIKLRMHGIFLSLFFALAIGFSLSTEASASHENGGNITAQEVDPANEDDVRAFLDHLVVLYKEAYNRVADPDLRTRELTIYNRQTREEGPYKDSANNMYSISINVDNIVINHSGHPDLLGYHFKPDAMGSAVAGAIQVLKDRSTADETVCESYGQNRVACATKADNPRGVVTIIAGLHHDREDSAFMLPDCSVFTLETTAQDVYENPTDENLKLFVQSIFTAAQNRGVAIIGGLFAEFIGRYPDLSFAELSAELGDRFSEIGDEFRQEVYRKLYSDAVCFSHGDFRHENIYGFVLDATDAENTTVLFSGNNSDLNGTSLELTDEELEGEDKSVGSLFRRALMLRPGEQYQAIGNSAYVNYRWDDPLDPDDDVENWFENKLIPGTSPKRTYIEVVDLVPQQPGSPLQGSGWYFIIGSGIYPEPEPQSGCAIAGAGHTSQGMLLNLFLVASVLFPFVFLRKRG